MRVVRQISNLRAAAGALTSAGRAGALRRSGQIWALVRV